MELKAKFFKEEKDPCEEDDTLSPFASVMDLSKIKPGEIEFEDEKKTNILWKKYRKYIKKYSTKSF